MTSSALPRVNVVGLGKLGAPLAAVLASRGFSVIGLDVNRTLVDAMNAGKMPIVEPQLNELIAANKQRLTATMDANHAVQNSDASFVIVPTPSDQTGFFSNRFVLQAMETLGRALRNKQGYHVVVITSTVMPGTTGGEIKAALEKASGRTVGPDLGLCYNPEFIALGSVVRDMLYPDSILIGESDAKAGDLLQAIYLQMCEKKPPVQRMNWVSAISEIAPIPAVIMLSTLMRTGPIWTASSKKAGTGMPLERTDTVWRNAPWINCATANEVNNSETKLAFRSGRKAISSIRTDEIPAAITPTSATTMNGAPA